MTNPLLSAMDLRKNFNIRLNSRMQINRQRLKEANPRLYIPEDISLNDNRSVHRIRDVDSLAREVILAGHIRETVLVAVDGVDVEVDEDRVLAVAEERDVAEDVLGGLLVDGEDGEGL